MTIEPNTPTGSPTPRTQVRRRHDRGVYDRQTVEGILDAGFLCHVAVVEDGAPRIVPMIYGRWGDRVVVHGALANQLLRSGTNAEVCLSATVVDGVVLARSTMHHSVNYRSVVVFGRLEEITDPEAKASALAAVVDQAVPGRTRHARGPTPEELRSTRVATLRLDEASAKVRTGPPVDDPTDDGLPVWSGVVPLSTVAGAPEPAPDMTPEVASPARIGVRGSSPAPRAVGGAG